MRLRLGAEINPAHAEWASKCIEPYYSNSYLEFSEPESMGVKVSFSIQLSLVKDGFCLLFLPVSFNSFRSTSFYQT